MTEPHRAVIARVSADFAAISAYLNRISSDLSELDRMLSQGPAVPQYRAPALYQLAPQQVPMAQPTGLSEPAPGTPQRSDGWIGKMLAVAGVAVTLIGVVLLLVLAAQAGILRPGFRVTAGVVLAAGLVGAAWWLYRRPGGRVGAIALAATGVATAYMDVIALTRIYDWVSAPSGLITAAVIGGGGLMLARRWNSEHLGLLVLVPLIGLAPVVTDGVTLLLVGFMLALSAASLPVQHGKDWIRLHAARTAASSVPLLVALAAAAIDDREDLALACACAMAAVLALTGGLLLLRWTVNPSAVAVLTAAGVVPLLCVSACVDRVLGALMVSTLAAALLAVVAIGDRLPGVTTAVRRIWSALAAVAALVVVTVAFDGAVAGPVLLAMAIVLAIAGRRDITARWAATGFGVAGGLFYLSYAPPDAVARATELRAGIAASVLIASVLLIAASVSISWSWAGGPAATEATVTIVWALAAVATGYAITTFTVTTGVLIGGTGGGFFGGHMAATICWMAVAAALFAGAARRPKERRSRPVGAGLALVAAAMAKLFLFDLGTLDGMFRVVVFIVVGLVLLGTGAGYARLLTQHDELAQRAEHAGT
ncbi:DUF2339 domain-containing protein [Mycobacterium sp. 21AC1]|uniref:DUF2339 domain-containing protein n=1 Tax=[Mycobacterium] appelbergii TaxID=2939269 RepID=UPI002938CFE7|nr:DUF2339 domain-containing protein [Mycobacterium sp. 21AC1]MDV3129223.1 DUF2339 domain-containing protein [Mycobacterium sp. 21AC1]